MTAISWPCGQKHGWETTTAKRGGFITQADTIIKPARLAVVVSHPYFWPQGQLIVVTESAQLGQSLVELFASFIFVPAYSQTVYKQFSDSPNIYGGAETNNEFLGEIGAELWTSLWDGEVCEASISMNNKRMDESDVSVSVVSPADYIPYFSLALDHLVST